MHKKWLEKKFRDRALFDEPMSLHTSFRVGGNADAYICPRNTEELTELIKWAQNNQTAYFIKGGGTNLLVKDKGIRGITIDLKKHFNEIDIKKKDGKKADITAMAGAKIASLCNIAIKYGFEGFEFAYGIPGTIGGAVSGNAGTAIGTIQNILNEIDILTQDCRIKRAVKEDINFSYRNLSVKEQPHPIIIKSFFTLNISEPHKVKKKAAEIIRERKKKQPTGSFCAGSFFKNPACGRPAGALIELAGLKGEIIGDAMISEKHANFIINRSNATAAQILELAELVKNRVKERFSINLEFEVKIVGE